MTWVRSPTACWTALQLSKDSRVHKWSPKLMISQRSNCFRWLDVQLELVVSGTLGPSGYPLILCKSHLLQIINTNYLIIFTILDTTLSSSGILVLYVYIIKIYMWITRCAKWIEDLQAKLPSALDPSSSSPASDAKKLKTGKNQVSKQPWTKRSPQTRAWRRYLRILLNIAIEQFPSFFRRFNMIQFKQIQMFKKISVWSSAECALPGHHQQQWPERLAKWQSFRVVTRLISTFSGRGKVQPIVHPPQGRRLEWFEISHGYAKSRLLRSQCAARALVVVEKRRSKVVQFDDEFKEEKTCTTCTVRSKRWGALDTHDTP